MSQGTPFPTGLHVRPAKTQNSLRICEISSESLGGNMMVVKDPKRLQADSEDSDQAAWMRRLI